MKKEKYLELLEGELREHGDDFEDSASDSSDNIQNAVSHTGLILDELYDVPRLESARENPLRNERKRLEERDEEDVTKVTSLPLRAISTNLSIAREHYRFCFVEVNPVQLRDIRALVLVGQDLQIHHLRSLSKNLFLFSALQSVNLSNNQLDDSSSKEISEDRRLSIVHRNILVKRLTLSAFLGDLMCCPGLQALDLSRNLLGRLTARTICERLRHQAKLRSLDLHGNFFFSDGGDAAGEVARSFAKGG